MYKKFDMAYTHLTLTSSADQCDLIWFVVDSANSDFIKAGCSSAEKGREERKIPVKGTGMIRHTNTTTAVYHHNRDLSCFSIHPLCRHTPKSSLIALVLRSTVALLILASPPRPYVSPLRFSLGSRLVL